MLGDQDSIFTDELQVRLPEEPGLFGEDKARCVSVDTKTAPGGRKKKEVFRKKKELAKYRCIDYENKLLQVKAKRSGLSLSVYCRR